MSAEEAFLHQRSNASVGKLSAAAFAFAMACLPASMVIAATDPATVAIQTAPAPGTRVVHDTWDFKDGAPQVTVVLAQTADGYLWLGTTSGLYRFDGTRFELFRSPFGDRLLSNSISELLAADGGLWVGYAFNGFSFVKNGRVRNFPEITGRVINFARDAKGTLWAGCNRAGQTGLWRFEAGIWRRIGAEWKMPENPVSQVAFDRDGILWVLSGLRGPEVPKDLYYLLPGERRFQKAAEGLHATVWTLDADKRVLTTSDAARDAGGFTVEVPGSLPSYPVLTTHMTQFIDRANSVWTATVPRGLVRQAAANPLAAVLGKFPPVDPETYDIAMTTTASLVDGEGSVWIASVGSVLHRFSYSQVMAWARPSSPSPDFNIVPGEGGAVWITASNSSGVSALNRVDARGTDTWPLPGGVAALGYRAPDGTFYFGGAGGLWHRVGSVLTKLELPPETAGQERRLQSMTQDASGAIWLSFGALGLYRLEDGRWIRHRSPAPAECPQSGVVYAFTDSLHRVILGCTASRLAVVEGDAERFFGPTDGIEVGNVTAIAGRGRSIWIGGEFGLQQFDGERFRTVRALDPEALRGISGIVERAGGDLWLNGLGGIVHILRTDIERALAEPGYPVNTQRFDRHSGVPGVPSQSAQFPTAVEGTDGRLWFSVNNAVVWIDPDHASPVATPAHVSIQLVVADDKVYEPAPSMTLPAHTSNVQISFAAVSLLHPDAIRFRYRLQGIDDEWHDAGRTMSVSYRSLPPGGYRFEVGATDTNGAWSKDIASAGITILPAFYQTGWFRALCGILLLALAWAAYRLRIRSLQRRFEMTLDARVAERTRIARELHDTLLQSFQSLLPRLQAVAELLPARVSDAKTVLLGTIDRASDAIKEGRQAVHDLRASASETNDLAAAIRTLGGTLSAEREGRAIDLRVEVQGTTRDLHPILRDEIFRIAGEALRNAFHHAEAQHVEVELRYDERRFQLRVRDDGRGMDPKLLVNEGPEGHFGLRGMRERAKLIGGTLTVWSAEGSGTEVDLVIPASHAYSALPAPIRESFSEKIENDHER